MTIHSAHIDDIAPRTLYALLKLRTDVFVGEQNITSEPEIDGLDLADSTLLVWAESPSGGVLSELRVLGFGATTATIGRVVTAPQARGAGLAARLVRWAAQRAFEAGASSIDLHAQAHLERWYASLGFRRVGEPFDEAGISHVLMRREREDQSAYSSVDR